MLYKACQLRSAKDQKVLAADLAAGEYAVSGTGRLFPLCRRKKADTAPKLLPKRKGHGHHHGLLPLRGVRRLSFAGAVHHLPGSGFLQRGKGLPGVCPVPGPGSPAAEHPAGNTSSDEPLHPGGGGLWRTEKQPPVQTVPHAGQDQYLTGTVPALPGL